MLLATRILAHGHEREHRISFNEHLLVTRHVATYARMDGTDLSYSIRLFLFILGFENYDRVLVIVQSNYLHRQLSLGQVSCLLRLRAFQIGQDEAKK